MASLFIILILIPLVSAFDTSSSDVKVSNLSDVTDQLKTINSELQDSINTNFVIISVSLAMSIVAITFTILQAYYLKRQVESTEQETDIRLQSWLVIEELMPIQVELKNGALVSYDEWSKSTSTPAQPAKIIKYQLTVKNIGLNVARNICDKVIVKDEKFSRQLFEEETEGIDGIVSVLAPNSSISTEISMTLDRFINLGNKSKFVGISVSYDGIKDRKYSGTIFELKRGHNVILDSWMD